MFFGVLEAGVIKLVELFLRNIEKAFFEAFLGKGGSAFAMFAIVAIIFAFAVVKECEQSHDCHVGTCNGR